MFSNREIMETIRMIEEEHLDVRTITMGISLLDCMDVDINKSCEKVYNKIYKYAKDLVKTGDYIAKKYGIPIINKRVSVTPISMLVGVSGGDPILYAKTLDKVASDIGIDFIGGYSSLVQKGFAPGDLELINSIPQALAITNRVCSSVNIGSTRAGINLDAVKIMGEKIVEAATLTKDRNCIGASKLVVFCNSVEDNPFMAGAYHGVGEADVVINIGVSGPGVVRAAVSKASKEASIAEIAEIIKKTAFKITRVGQLIATEAAKMLDAESGIVDLSLAPTPAIGDSVGRILEEMGLSTVGGHGTTACLAILNDAVKKGGVMASSKVGGLSGAFIPVSEDEGMISAAEKGVLTLNKLEAMTAVCSVGIDMVAIPGDTPESTISAIIADEAAIGMVNNKTTAVRIIPVPNKTVGDSVEFGGLLGRAPIMAVNNASAEKFISRGGIIPAPIHGNKN